MRQLLLVFLILIISNLSFAQLYTFKNYSYKDGLSMANVSSVFQSHNGTIWLGTDGAGLVSYNGYNFQEIYTDKSDNDHHVTSIMEEDGLIYFTSRYKGVFTYSNGIYKKIVSPLPDHGDFLNIFQFDTNKIIITTSGVYLFASKKLTKLHSFQNLSNIVTINNLIRLNTGYLILSSKGNFHLSFKSNRITPLNNWLHVSKQAVEFVEFGYTNGESVFLFDKFLTKKLEVILNHEDAIYKLNSTSIEASLASNETVISLSADNKTNSSAVLTSKNALYISNNKGYHKIAHNFDQPLEECRNLIIDRNGDYWINSTIKGLYKISLEPFTKIQLHPIYSSASIRSLFKSSTGEIVISAENESTFIGDLYSTDSRFEEFNFRTNAIVEYKNQLLLGTNDGIIIYDKLNKKLNKVLFPEFSKEKVTFLFIHNEFLWVGIAGKGLSKYSLRNGYKKIEIQFDERKTPYVYTAQLTDDQQTIYFGTNNGIVEHVISKNTYTSLKISKKLGSFIGVSTRDVNGNLWFTGEKAILGILKNGEQVLLDDRKMFPSTLFYTLNSDNYGNLIIGTNKGINIISLNEYGEVLNFNWYQGKTGFEGYETNMRAQYQDGNNIFVGTVEGLFLINTSILQNMPKPSIPVIHTDQRNIATNNENTILFQFLINNPKIKNIQYSYRIVGFQDKWSNFTKENKLILSDLPNGDFILEVKATYNGTVFSDIGRYPFSVKLSFWKSRWFVFILLFLVVLINVYLINRNKSFSTGNLFETKDTSVTVKMTPQILLFGFLADTAIHVFCPYLDSDIRNNLGVTLFIGFVMLALYLLSLTAKKNNQTYQYKNILIAGFIVALSHNLIDTFYSHLHPFYIIAVVLINSLAPFIFERVKTVVIYSLIFILINCIFVLLLDETVYTKSLFLIAILFAAFFGVIAAYLRYDSLEKLLFISGVINKGNVPTIAFNSEGIMTYVSENISDTIEVNHEALIGQHISYLNTFVPEEGNFRRVDLTQDFEDGKKYLVPMLSSNQEVQWMEWSCKIFTENVKVILGQNVTSRLELESTYELLVQNAEDLIYQCDENGYFRFLNNQCYDRLEYTEIELQGRHSLDLVSEEYKMDVKNFYRKHFEDRKISSYHEFPIETKNGKVIWVGQHVTTLYKPGDRKIINGFLALARDITLTREQQEIIKEQRDDITASINYAQKIQLNLLPNRDKFNLSFEESCVFYKPKDIVSGDFYWLERIEDMTILALGDCTGHGVPGSFMTLLGINLINNIVLEQRIFNPGRILDELDKKLIAALPRENGVNNMNDGMEITICVFNHKTSELSYACAGSRFLVFESQTFTMYKGDSRHIGDQISPDFKGYVTHFKKFKLDATLYLFTDGFQDQFGGLKNKKYSFRRMIELFDSNIRLPLSEQQNVIEDEFEKWKLEFVQTDDVTILAFRHLVETEKS